MVWCRAIVVLGLAVYSLSGAAALADAPESTLGPTSVADPSSAATEKAEGPPTYQAAADLGLAEFERGNYLEARARFAEAHRVWPNARSLRALGYCEYELKNYATSLDLLQRALASTVRPLNEAQRAETSELIGRARGYVARYTLTVFPPDAQLSVDGDVPALDAEHALTLSVGTHVLDARAPGHLSVRQTLQVESNQDRVIAVTLEPLPTASSTQQQDEPLRKKWWLWASVGAVVVAGVTGGLVAGLRDPGTASPSGGNTEITLGVWPLLGDR